MSQRLPNYLKSHRKRSGLSQDEVAFLLGCASGAKVSRYERMVRQPTLETALACEAVYGVPVRTLFAGVYEKVEATIHQRAQALAGTLSAAKPDRFTRQKLAGLAATTSAAKPEPIYYGISANR
jgi:transcriptional regulator with XRE-family HTH domain